MKMSSENTTTTSSLDGNTNITTVLTSNGSTITTTTFTTTTVDVISLLDDDDDDKKAANKSRSLSANNASDVALISPLPQCLRKQTARKLASKSSFLLMGRAEPPIIKYNKDKENNAASMFFESDSSNSADEQDECTNNSHYATVSDGQVGGFEMHYESCEY
jgi:hypothetical protein